MSYGEENIVLGMMGTAMAIVIGIGAFFISDAIGEDKLNGEAIVISKSFSDEFCSTIFVDVGNNVMAPITTCYEKNWSLKVKQVQGRDTSSASVSEGFYNSIQEGDIVEVTYRSGRWTGGFYVKSINGKVN